MKILIALLMTFTATSSFAGEICENFAKYHAIRSYKAESGTIQGSEGIEYSAELISITGNEYLYEVSVTDNNEDQEYWTVVYMVLLKPIQGGNKCQLLDLKWEAQEE